MPEFRPIATAAKPEPLPVAAEATTYIEGIQALVATDMQSVDTEVRSSLYSEVALINRISDYIIGGGGKRLRPVLHLLAARACGYRHQRHIKLAAIIEFIHTATLLHDDVVDESGMRRGQDTANAVWGNAASVLVGDFLYSRAFQMMVTVDSMRVMDILAETTNTIAEGEVLQLLNLGNPETDEARYLEVIRCKTAKLFEAAARLGAVLAECDSTTERAMADYGMHLGTAFQLADDMLDYTGDADELGKNIGDDLAEGKPTLPLIYVLRQGSQRQQQLVQEAMAGEGRARLGEVVEAIKQSDALAYTEARALEASQRAQAALAVLSNTPYRDALDALARFSIARRT